MNYFFIFSLAVLAILFIFQIFRKKDFDLGKLSRSALIGSSLAALIYYLYLVYQQYFTWFSAGPPASYFLPPYQSWSYVFGYHFTRFGLKYIISLAGGLFFLLSAKALNKKYEERFFEKEELYLGALAIFLTGTPGEVFYFGGLIGLYLLLHLILVLLNKLNVSWSSWGKNQEARLPMYWLWLPLAIFVIIIMNLNA